MSNKLDRVCAALFPAEGATVVNVKFFPGNNRVVTADQLADQLGRADAQLRAGTAVRTTKLDAGLTQIEL